MLSCNRLLLITRILLLSTLLLSSACSLFVHTTVGDTHTLPGLLDMHASIETNTSKKGGVSKIRRVALEETAMSLGARAGLASRAQEINAELKLQAKKLDHIYNFQALILNHNVLPPVLLQGNKTLNLDNPAAIRISDRTYRIEHQARFITTAPNWRDYLWMNYEPPEQPHATVLPKDRNEREIWQEFIRLGWDQGVKQADTIFDTSIARLTQDFKGMVLYRKLLAQNMVSPPYVAHADLGVTGDSTEIHINDQVLRITALPGLNTNSQTWKPAVSQHAPSHHRVIDWKTLAQHHATHPKT